MSESKNNYVCVRQRAGPLVKQFSTDRKGFIRANGENARQRCGEALSRDSVNKLELRLALFEYDGIFYGLSFAPENLPKTYKDAQRIWGTFLKRLKRWRKGAPFDYVYRIEGKHDDYHIHAFIRESDVPQIVVQSLWDFGESGFTRYDRKMILRQGGYYRLARYFLKEKPEVGQHPWGVSRTLRKKIPLPEVRNSDTPRIRIPRDAHILPQDDSRRKSEWGVYTYTKYLCY